MFGIATGKGKKNIFQYISVFNWRHFAPPPDKGKCWFISIPVSPPPCVLFTSFSPLYQEHPRKYNSCHAHYCRGCCGVSPKVLDDSQALLYLNVFFELLNLLSWGSYNGFFVCFFLFVLQSYFQHVTYSTMHYNISVSILKLQVIH